MQKPVCVPCGLVMTPERNGVLVLETRDRFKSEPYRIWSADVWSCPGCGHEVLSGYSDRTTYPTDPDYEEKLAEVELTFY